MEATALPRVVIIGAGAAGIAAASALSRRRFQVTVLEAGSRLGGRIRTIHADGAEYELGATWVHGRTLEENPLLRFADSLPLQRPPSSCVRGGGDGAEGAAGGTTKASGRRSPVRWDAGETGEEVNGAEMRLCVHAYDAALEECMRLAKGLEVRGLPAGAPPADVASAVDALVSQEASLREVDADLARRAFAWRAAFECAVSGCDGVADLSLEAWGENDEPGASAIAMKRWQGGYSALIQAAAAALPEEKVRVCCGCRATAVRWAREEGPLAKDAASARPLGGVCVRYGDGEGEEKELEAEHVICTASLGVLKSTVRGEGALRFEPALPAAKRSAIERLGFGTVDKVLLQYAEPWWEASWGRLHVSWSPAEEAPGPAWLRGLYCFWPAPLGQGLECWLSGPAARGMEACSDEEVMAAMHSFLCRCAGGALDPPFPSGITRSAWGSDPDFRGSYSFVSVDSTGDDLDVLAVPEGEALQLLLAGEHTHRSSYSYVHGAWLSGVRAGEKVASYHETASIKD